MKKKICYITTVSLTLKAFVLSVAEYLASHTDWEITMICDGDEEFAKSLPKNIRYIPVPMKRGVSLSAFKAISRLKKIFKEEKFDLIQYSTPNASLYAAIAGKKAKIPVRLYCQWGMAYVGMKGLKRKIFKVIEKQVCRMSTWIEPDSHSNLAFSHQEGLYKAEKGSVIGAGSACGVNLQKFDISRKEEYRKEIREKYNLPSDAFVYIFVGRITKDKGIDELLSAYKKLQESGQNTYLLLVGREEATEELNQENYDWSKVCDRVIYTGPTTEVEKYLAASDCYLLPSYREGFGLGTVEAEAMGVPVIVTDIPGPIDAMLPGETGLTVPKGDAEALYQAMKEIPEKDLVAMGKKGYAFAVENFEREKLCALILEDRKRLLDEAK
ncbi:MAG: glycosyltransferase family 4 protein [Clostridia bacterium]|nr:glycosyltransferase family 4 protein [Clostridia bacterium]